MPVKIFFHLINLVFSQFLAGVPDILKVTLDTLLFLNFLTHKNGNNFICFLELFKD